MGQDTTTPRFAMTAPDAVALLSEHIAGRYRLVGPLAGGETGATEIRDSDDTRFVLKWELDVANQQSRRDGARLAERLRTEAGWPSPQQQLIETDGCLLVVQEFMAGDDVDHLSHRVVDQIVDIHEARLALTTTGESSTWAEDMIELLVEGGNGYCLHEPLRAFDPRTRRVVECIEDIGRTTSPDSLDGHAIVHADLHPGNLLQVDGELSAVVDMDYTRVGDAAFDLTILAVASLGTSADPGVRHRLFDLGLHTLPRPKRRVYAANLLLRNLDWSIRKNRRNDTTFWLAEADRLLADDES